MTPSSQSIMVKFSLLFLFSILVQASDWDEEHPDHHNHIKHDYGDNPPKDRVLLSGVKSLSFFRNKRTTSRRTHPIHQLSCVGGTAGCKLFTPDVVECENQGIDKETQKLTWRCHAEIGDRVAFNHVEVQCEGYDYHEDDYVLLGSCGLEFTLDYKDPHDYHDKSYYKHMDDHEKMMHQEKVRPTGGSRQIKQAHGILSFYHIVISGISSYMFLVGAFVVFALVTLLAVKLFTSRERKYTSGRKGLSKRANYGPITSAVMSTKKIT